MKISPVKNNYISFRSRNNEKYYIQDPNVLLAQQKSGFTKKDIKMVKNIIFVSLAVAAATAALKFLRGKPISPYVKSLAKSLGEEMQINAKSKNLKSIMSGKELLTELKTLKPENYCASHENLKKGIFLADLHSHSNFSDGQASVASILNQVAEYADYAYAKTGKKFIYSLTDHDNADGVKEAIKIIYNNPKKFKNVRFITGSELSFAIKADKTSNQFETSEVLVYGFNPFDKAISAFFKDIQTKREYNATKFIDDLNRMFKYADFSLEELCDIYKIDRKRNGWLMNSQWKVHHYGQTKNAVAGLANSLNKDKSVLYKEIMLKTEKDKMALGNLRDSGIIPKSYGDDSNITNLCKEKYSPHLYLGNIDYAGENNFDDIVNIFGKNDDTFFALAHPYYITERNSNAEAVISDLCRRSKGCLKASESYHQAYTPNIPSNHVKAFNQSIVSKNNLMELGGYDNHKKDWVAKI